MTTPVLWIIDEIHDYLDGLCVTCMGRGCINCMRDRRIWQPADWETTLDHLDRTPPLDPDRIHALDQQPVPAGAVAAGECEPIHPPGWLIGAEPVTDPEQQAAEVLRIIASARKAPAPMMLAKAPADCCRSGCDQPHGARQVVLVGPDGTGRRRCGPYCEEHTDMLIRNLTPTYTGTNDPVYRVETIPAD
ncbi:hypothetical protein [Actinomadura geliboluensis]|uniref:hypothetical protein n=1 Tax=Actinomadura geliboluensis TaxID=882440 RepID=UPI0036B5334D